MLLAFEDCRAAYSVLTCYKSLLLLKCKCALSLLLFSYCCAFKNEIIRATGIRSLYSATDPTVRHTNSSGLMALVKLLNFKSNPESTHVFSTPPAFRLNIRNKDACCNHSIILFTVKG